MFAALGGAALIVHACVHVRRAYVCMGIGRLQRCADRASIGRMYMYNTGEILCMYAYRICVRAAGGKMVCTSRKPTLMHARMVP